MYKLYDHIDPINHMDRVDHIKSIFGQIAIKLVFVVKDKWGNVCCYVVCPTRALSFNDEPMHIIMMQGEPIGHTDWN